jgi:arsenate reductase (glutaredoxin)
MKTLAALGKKIKNFEKQDIKSEPMTLKQIDEMKKRAGSYEALFSRKSRKFRSLGYDKQVLAEADYRRLIKEEYTFLKRPVFIVDDMIFIGTSKAVLDDMMAML